MALSGADIDGLTAVAEEAAADAPRGLPPVHLWNPPNCGEIDIRICRDGVWLHEGRPITRPELVRLFSTVLRKDADGYWLVTPVEKLAIQVEDLPFRAVAVERRDGTLIFTTDMGDQVAAGRDHPIEVEIDAETGEPAPRIRVRANLWARIGRATFYELVDVASVEDRRLVVRSDGADFILGATEADSE